MSPSVGHLLLIVVSVAVLSACRGRSSTRAEPPVGDAVAARPISATATNIAVRADTAPGSGEGPTFDRASFCKRMGAESRKVQKKCGDDCRHLSAPRKDRPSYVPWARFVPFGSCIASSTSRWALVLERATPARYEGAEVGEVQILYSLVHGLPGGGDVRLQPWLHDEPKPKAPTNLVISRGWLGQITYPSLGPTFDWDGDGDEELVLYASSWSEEGGDKSHAGVFSFKAGHIVPYAPTAGLTIDEVKDVDHDGRPDILTPGPYADVSADMGGGFDAVELAENLFVAHSLPDGTFSLSDPVAVAAARRWCPRSPHLTFARDGEVEENEEKVRCRHNASIICARLWGRTTKSLTRAISAACPCAHDKALLRDDKKRACEASGVGPFCNDAIVQLKWVKLEPPLRLN